MKTLLKYSFFSFFALATFLACDNSEDLVLTEQETVFEVNGTNFSNLVLNSSFPENAAVTISWKDKFDNAASYEVVMATDEAFTNEISLGTSDDTNFTITVAELNQLLLDSGAEPYKVFPIYVRITNGTESTSALSYNVKTYAVDGPIITNPVANSSINLDADNPDDTALDFMWTDFSTEGTAISIAYTIEIARAGTNFEMVQSFTPDVNATTFSITNEQLNIAALNLGVTENTSGSLEARLVAAITSDTGINIRTSEAVAFSTTTYLKPLPMFYVVGNFLSASGYGNDWNTADAVPLASSEEGATDYQGFVYFANGDSQYKFLPTDLNFEGDYGDTGMNNGDYSQAIEANDEVNCGLPNAENGFYLVQMNTTTNSYSLRKQVWSMIGAATPNEWSDPDTDMTYNPGDKIWEVDLYLKPGEFLFRANNNWNDDEDKLGGNGQNGKVQLGGTNLKFEGAEGNYHVVLDLSNPRNYSYTITAI